MKYKFYNQEEKMMDTRFATIASFFIPGLGQALLGDIKRGAIFFVIGIIIWFLLMKVSTRIPFSGIISLLYGAYSAYDTYNIAQN
jgi:TM2 domain-containing membrane protein YozV